MPKSVENHENEKREREREREREQIPYMIPLNHYI
jgi:hypothetical protein